MSRVWDTSDFNYPDEYDQDSIDQFLARGGLDFEVEMRPLIVGGTDIVVPDKVALIRNDRHNKDAVLGTVSPNYTPMQYRETLVAPREFSNFLKPEASGHFGNGEVGFALYRLYGLEMEVFPGDTIIPMIMFASSHNGSIAYQASLVTEREASGAIYNHPSDNEKLKLRHYKNALDDFTSMRSAVLEVTKEAKYFSEFIERLANTHFTRDMWNDFIDELLPNPRKTQKTESIKMAITGLFHSGEGQHIAGVSNTAWAAWQAVLEYTTWFRPTRVNIPTNDYTREMIQAEYRLESVLFGTGSKFCQKAESILRKMVG